MRILVIEDTQKHLNDAKKYVKGLVGCMVDFATTLCEAEELLMQNQYDGVISDVFFPAKAGTSAETFMNAIAINSLLIAMGVHHVFNTAGNHHGRKYKGFIWKTPHNPLTESEEDHRSGEYGRRPCYDFRTTGMIIEAYPNDSDGEKDAKQWQAAFRYILLAQTLLGLPDKGEGVVKDAKELRGFPYGEYGGLTKSFAECSHPFVVETFQKFNA
ncbi:response regulator [Candidatus Kaiserbacteria bacterium]|nr:response regulator [Candidatus Kaiserbacteria bacterium]